VAEEPRERFEKEFKGDLTSREGEIPPPLFPLEESGEGVETTPTNAPGEEVGGFVAAEGAMPAAWACGGEEGD